LSGVVIANAKSAKDGPVAGTPAPVAAPAAVSAADCTKVETKLSSPTIPAMSYADPDPSEFELVQVQVVMRHGARSTCGLLTHETKEGFANDWRQCHDESQSLDDPELRPCTPGQLTVNGEHMCVELGRRLRARYADDLHFLPDAFDESEMHIESTNYGRARLSLKRALQGLFPAGAPTQTHLDDQVDPDNLLITRLEACNQLLRSYRAQHARSVAEIEAEPRFQDLRARAHAGSGVDLMGAQSWVAVGDWAHSRSFHGIPLKDGLPADFLPVVERAAWHEFRQSLTASPQSIRLGLGPLIDRIVAMADYGASRAKPAGADVRTNVDLYAAEKADAAAAKGTAVKAEGSVADYGATATTQPSVAEAINKVTVAAAAPAAASTAAAPIAVPARTFKPVNQDPYSPHPHFSVLPEKPPKLVVYSGHDTTLTPLAAALGVPLRSWPPFSSHMELELWRHKSHDPSAEGGYAYNKLESIMNHRRDEEFAHTDVFPPGTQWPHVTRANATPRTVNDPFWVRAVFNGDVVRVMPLGHFKETMASFMTGGLEQRRAECGPYDANIGKWIWAQPPKAVIKDAEARAVKK
jgi:hypothetical protein